MLMGCSISSFSLTHVYFRLDPDSGQDWLWGWRVIDPSLLCLVLFKDTPSPQYASSALQQHEACMWWFRTCSSPWLLLAMLVPRRGNGFVPIQSVHRMGFIRINVYFHSWPNTRSCLLSAYQRRFSCARSSIGSFPLVFLWFDGDDNKMTQTMTAMAM